MVLGKRNPQMGVCLTNPVVASRNKKKFQSFTVTETLSFCMVWSEDEAILILASLWSN